LPPESYPNCVYNGVTSKKKRNEKKKTEKESPNAGKTKQTPHQSTSKDATPQKIKNSKNPKNNQEGRKIKSEAKEKTMVRRKKNILLCTTQKIKSRISHLINFARLTKRTMGWAVHHPLRPGKLHHQRPCRIVISSSSSSSYSSSSSSSSAPSSGCRGSQRHHTLSLRKSKTSTPSGELGKIGGCYSLSLRKSSENGENGGKIGLALCDSSVDIYFDFSFECRT